MCLYNNSNNHSAQKKTPHIEFVQKSSTNEESCYKFNVQASTYVQSHSPSVVPNKPWVFGDGNQAFRIETDVHTNQPKLRYLFKKGAAKPGVRISTPRDQYLEILNKAEGSGVVYYHETIKEITYEHILPAWSTFEEAIKTKRYYVEDYGYNIEFLLNNGFGMPGSIGDIYIVLQTNISAKYQDASYIYRLAVKTNLDFLRTCRMLQTIHWLNSNRVYPTVSCDLDGKMHYNDILIPHYIERIYNN